MQRAKRERSRQHCVDALAKARAAARKPHALEDLGDKLIGLTAHFAGVRLQEERKLVVDAANELRKVGKQRKRAAVQVAKDMLRHYDEKHPVTDADVEMDEDELDAHAGRSAGGGE